MVRKTSKKDKGITFIALIVTIIVLLILAGITINLVVNNNRLTNKAKTAKGIYENRQNYELEELEKTTNKIADYETSQVIEGDYILKSNNDLLDIIARINKGENFEGKVISLAENIDLKDVCSEKLRNFMDTNWKC